MLQASVNCLNLIESEEELRLVAYKPDNLPGEVWTIGWGHTRGVCEGMQITVPMARTFLLEDVRGVEADLNPMLQGIQVTQDMYDALVSLCFNLRGGPRVLPREAPKLWAALQQGRRADCAAQFLDMDHAGGVVLSGLKARRAKEAALFLS